MNRWYRYGLAGLCCTAFFLSAAAPAHDPVETERYRVQPGDTLWEITERYRGDASEWPILRETNGVKDPRRLQPGDILDLPRLPELTAEVRHCEGSAWLIGEDGRRVPLHEDMLIAPGDTLETGSRTFVSLRLPHGEDVVLPSNSRVTLKQQNRRHARLYLKQGELEAHVPAQRDYHEVLDIDTPTGVIGVRGTRLRVTHAEDGIRVSTLEGKVVLKQGERTTSVPAGQGVLARTNAFPQVAILLPPPELKADEHSFDHPLQIQLSEVAGAESYRVQLARDPDFQTIFRDEQSNTRLLTFDSVPRGFYYARGSALDALGIEGRYGRRLVLHRPVETALDTSDDGYTFRWTDIPGLEYRLQLSEDSSFSDPFLSRSFSDSQGVTLRNLPTDEFFWRLQVSGDAGKFVDSPVVASGRQGAAHQP
ncbi:FecR domain-containing protein [Halomonas elongata]|uniref:FecR domain-containing protein n=1 Tax=Halomonas elongata TaxID=2746 RepID=UPI00186B913F|nr:FecR domain-containing protein [Halomonas elongata]MBW5801363.1 FecR domain-containing protein [Halomonas elongata]WVI72294.1 FecR domain-containing protein [Halomonas elongata]